MKILILTLIFSLNVLTAPISNAQDCTEKTCVNVYTENGQLVIEAHKNGQQKIITKIAPRPVKKIIKKPVIKRSYAPRTPNKPVVKRSKKPSLADRIIKALPSTGIAYQPAGDALIGVPTYFWVDLPSKFETTIPILGEKIGIEVQPVMNWNFGDGQTLVTTKNGGPYPNGSITHSYAKPGYYLLSMTALWRGFWILNGVRAPIPGTIEQVAEMEIRAVSAETYFVNN